MGSQKDREGTGSSCAVQVGSTMLLYKYSLASWFIIPR